MKRLIKEFNSQKKTLGDVFGFMANSHNGQYRTGAELPFAVHPASVLRVAAVEWEIYDRDTLDAILCHDIKEDCPHVPLKDIENMIGKKSVSIVDELTFVFDKNGSGTKPEQKLVYMSSFMTKSIQALVCKMADRVDNTCDFLLTNPNYAAKYWQKASGLIEAFQSREEEIIEHYGVASSACMKYSRNIIDMKVQ